MKYAVATTYTQDLLPQPEKARHADSSLTIAHIAPNEDAVKVSSGKIVLPTMEGLCFEKTKHIAYLEASGNYTVIHFMDGRQVLVCRTLCDVEAQLPGHAFIRIHRSHTIHLRHLKKYLRGKGGHVLLQNGATLAVSAGQKDTFMEAVKTYFS
jgi:two-component system, LytTR family, response regulator